MNYDRRQHPRFIPDSALLVSLGQSKRGFLKDVSESGMAFDGLLPNSGNNVIYLAFDLPDGGGAIEAVAEVVWTCEALHRTGVRFLELAEASRRQLRHWISSRVFTLSEKASEEEKDAVHYPAVQHPTPLPALASPLAAVLVPDLTLSDPIHAAPLPADEHKEVHPGILAAAKIRLPHVPASVGVVLAILFVSTACVSLGYYLPGIILGSGRGPVPVTGSLAATQPSNPAGPGIVAANDVAANRSAATKSPVSAILPGVVNANVAVSATPKSGGFVLQVAAMAQAVNAAKLIDKLRQKHFPAFLADRGRDTLYRVQVGPYEDMNYARTVAGDLKSAGFSAVLRHRADAQPDSN